MMEKLRGTILVFFVVANVIFEAESEIARNCAEKMFNGRPKEWSSRAGKEIEAHLGYWTLTECKNKCIATKDCREFRVKKSVNVSYSGCVLMRQGTTESGEWTSSFEMYRLVECPQYKHFPQKLFDGRPKEWKSTSGKEIQAYNGFWNLNDCQARCLATPDCNEFRVKKSSSVSYSGCVLMKEGTTESGELKTSFEMYKLVPNSPYRQCSQKMFDGRPKEWRSSSGKEIQAYDGYWTLEDCKSRCLATPACREFRIKKNARVSYSGCVLMHEGTTKSGEHTANFEMYKLIECKQNYD